MSRSKIFRISMVVILVLLWWWLRTLHSPLATGLMGSDGVSARTLWWGATTSAVILSIYILAILWLLLSPWRSRGPDDAMGIGCTWLILWIFVGMLALLAVGMIWQIRLLIIPIGVMTLFTAIPVAGGLIAELIKWWRKKLASGGEPQAQEPTIKSERGSP